MNREIFQAQRIEALERELAEIRSILASTDVASLPNDYPTTRMAEDRMRRINELTLDGLAWIGRHEALEAALREIATTNPKLTTAQILIDVARCALEGK